MYVWNRTIQNPISIIKKKKIIIYGCLYDGYNNFIEEGKNTNIN